ncbi:unnamed protein product [Rhizoctonia solani]|uniref:Uncharacterized protein n=1 Tax=Rhizoctonia solani TaxID=456999 RepID=A0A8H2WVJ5_9AGAM|nr:unnamed protein product [Rhizoctonia solani]
MLPALLDNICLGGLRVERLSSLAHAAECLAAAASTLSEAARAAAESMAFESASGTKDDTMEATKTINDPTPEESELLTDPPLSLILLNPAPDPISLPTEPESDDVEKHDEEVEPSVDIEDILTTGLGGYEPDVIEIDKDDEVSIYESVSEPVADFQEHPDMHDDIPGDEPPVETHTEDSSLGHAVIPTEVETPINPKQAYRIIVENEFDVLLSVCALIEKNQRVICYMPCGTPPLSLYKQLIEGVTSIPVCVPERMSSAKQDAAYRGFLQNDNSIVLIPGTIPPNVVMEGTNTWVIHVGWPPNHEKYLSQIKKHQARNNVVIACSGDLDLYSSRAPLMARTQIWPKCGDPFTASVNALRQSFEQTLAKIPDHVKEKVYPDWIQYHGSYGPRYVKAWNSIALVQQANYYLLHVVKYRRKSLNSGAAEEELLPEVSSGFIAQNSLQLAFQAGVIHVKHDSGLNHISSLAQTDIKSPTLSASEVNGSTAGTSIPGPSNRLHLSEKIKRKGSISSAGTPSEQVDFKLAPGHTYFTIDEEFDAIPLMCFIAGKYDKAICFLEGQGSLRHYQKLFSKILPSTSLVIAPEMTNSDQANNDAASRFVSSSVSAVLLLTYSTTNLPSVLRERKVGCCVYWGFHLPLKQGSPHLSDFSHIINWILLHPRVAKKHRDQLTCPSTTMIVSKSQQSELKRQSTDVKEHPGARALLDLGPKSVLWSMRNTTVSVLMTEETTAKGLYVNRIYGLGTVSRTERSAEEVVRMANRYSAKILLRGVAEDASENFPPVAGKLPIPRTVVDRFTLQPAIDAGLASIG